MKQLGQRLGVKGILPPEPEGVGLSEISHATCLLSGNLLLDSIVFFFFFPPKIFCPPTLVSETGGFVSLCFH